jgi:predicted RNA-binding protein with TRAM domain
MAFRRGFRRFGPREYGSRMDDVPKPVKVGEEYDVEINEVGSRGDGIARVKNFVVFVNGAKQGEKVKIKITDVRDRFATGEKVGAAGAVEEAAEEVSEEAGEEETSETESVEEETETEEV